MERAQDMVPWVHCCHQLEKEKPKQSSHKGNEADLVIKPTEKCTSFWRQCCLLGVSGLFCLITGVWSFPVPSESTPPLPACASECCLLFSGEKDMFNKLRRWSFPMRPLSGQQSAVWHAASEHCAHALWLQPLSPPCLRARETPPGCSTYTAVANARCSLMPWI